MSAALAVKLALVLLFFAGSWFFSGFESGMVSLNRHRLIHLVRRGDAAARRLAELLRDTHRLLATTLVGNNICNVTLATLAAALAAQAADGLGGPAAQALATFLVACLLLVVGEYLPKLWFTARPLARCRPLAPLFLAIRAFLWPLASLCILLTRMAAGRDDAKRSPFVSRESLAFLMRDSEANGQISAFERAMVGRVLELQLRRASQLMTPLAKVARVSEDDPLPAVLETFRRSRHRVLPLFSADGRHCLGLLHLSDLLRARAKAPVPFDLRRAPVTVRGDVPADELLPYMHVRRTKVLIVTDGAGPIGLVTQEDVLNAILDDRVLHASTGRRAAKRNAARPGKGARRA